MSKNEQNTTIKTSHVFPSGKMAEMIFDPQSNISVFAVGSGEDGSVEAIQFEDFVSEDEVKIKPLDANDKLLKLNFVRFPTKVHPYDNNLKLYGMVKHYINKYMYLPPDFLEVVAVYVMMTWLYDRFAIVPYLRVLGGFGSGKTRFLKVVGNLCYKSMFYGGSTTTAAIYRTLDFIRGTMTFDETDFRNSDMSSDIVKVLNQGHDKNFPVVRMEPIKEGGFVTKVFNVFGPKVFASRERFADEALESRCVTQRLQYEKDLKHPIILPDDNEDEANLVRSCLLMFRFSNFKKLDISESDIPNVSTHRIKQTFMELISVAKLISEDVVQSVIKFAEKADRDLKALVRNSAETDILICLLEMIHPTEQVASFKKKIYMKDIANKYADKFYDDLNDRKNRYTSHEEGGLMIIPNYKISAKRIGYLVNKLGINKERDSDGFYIDAREYKKIRHLGEYYGVTEDMLNIEREVDPEPTKDNLESTQIS